tara:strand:+ start:1183 stop:2457 length:1275 start_codon:yes stop_codon:yes gene_type:complete
VSRAFACHATVFIGCGLVFAPSAPGALPGTETTVEPGGASAPAGDWFAWLMSARASIELTADVVTTGNLELRDVAVPLELSDGQAVVERGSAKTDSGDVTFTGTYAIAARKLRASIHSNGISLAPASAADETPARLFRRTPLVPRWLPGLNGVLDVQLERLHYAGTDASAISASAVFDPSRLEIAIRAAFGDGVLTLDGTHAYAAGETRITAAANAVELDRIAPVRQYLSGAKLDGTAELSGTGHTGHELAAGLGGRVRAQIGRGTLNHVKLELLSQNLLAMTLLSVIPFQHPAPRTPLECAALRLDLARGRTGTEAVPVIVARSDKLLLIGRGTLDLGTEQIALKLQPARHTALTLDAPGNPRTVSINGPLRAPVVKSSAGDWLHESLAIGASLATNPLARAANKVFARNKTPRTSCAAVLGD